MKTKYECVVEGCEMTYDWGWGIDVALSPDGAQELVQDLKATLAIAPNKRLQFLVRSIESALQKGNLLP